MDLAEGIAGYIDCVAAGATAAAALHGRITTRAATVATTADLIGTVVIEGPRLNGGQTLGGVEGRTGEREATTMLAASGAATLVTLAVALAPLTVTLTMAHFST